jgi:uncharacterized coiled-coil DUF342 family protein
MTRLTPEREKAIKLTADKGMSPECRGYVYELLAEIDRLRVENKDFDEQRTKYFHSMQDLHKERDQLCNKLDVAEKLLEKARTHDDVLNADVSLMTLLDEALSKIRGEK